MTKAEAAALKAYPKEDGKMWHSAFGLFEFDKNAGHREGSIKGYEQAVKDLANECIEMEDAIILRGLIDYKTRELCNIESKKLLKDFCHKIGASAVNVIIKKR